MFTSRRNSSQVNPNEAPPLGALKGQGGRFPDAHQSRTPSSGSVPRFSTDDDLHRVGTNGTMDSRSVTSKSEKRRSGIFGFGKKDKDKPKDRDRDERPAELRSSFSVDRSKGRQPLPPDSQRNPEPGFIPRQMPDQYAHRSPSNSTGQQYPLRQGSPLNQAGPAAPLPPLAPSSSPLARPAESYDQRVVSSPPVNGGNFAGGAPQGLPKSQSMGFNQSPNPNNRVPDTHPYRSFLNSQNGQPVYPQSPQNGSIPRSNSMPLDKLNDQAARSTSSPVSGSVKGSPSLDRIKVGEPGVVQPWMKQFDGIVELIAVQPQKTYVASPPELEMILARTSAGGQPKQGQPGSASNDWDSVWLQLSGISLSMWSMKETRAAAAKGEKVPPTYFNITDSSLELLAPLPPPPHRPNSHPHHFVFSLNTAGSNRLLFSCPSERDLAKWSLGLRLAAWERARLEEIYTGHLIKAGGREPASDLVRGRMEGWVRVRVMGGTDWKRLWVVLSTPNAPEEKVDEKKSRRRSFFGLGEKEKDVVQEPNTGVSMASFYLEPRTPKNKTSVAVLTVTNVTQAYAVFPERLEVMSQSNLMKVVGRIGGELVTIEGRLRDSGWALIMPETAEPSTGTPPTQSPLSNMMKWVTGVHDVFGLYGRPERYNWNPNDMRSLFFAYPQGPRRQRLFLDIEEALAADFRVANLPAIRQQFSKLVEKRLNAPAETYREDGESDTTPRPEGNYRLPPLQFDNSSPAVSTNEGAQPRTLTPITERTDIASRNNSVKTATSTFFMNDRRVSDGHSAKQNSGGSSRHVSGGAAEDRLAPISDSTETFTQFTEEPAEQLPMPITTPTTVESATAPTTWSQASGASPSITPVATPQESVQPAFPVPPIGNLAKNAGSNLRQRLPPSTGQISDLPTKQAVVSPSAQSSTVPLAAPIPSVVTPKAPSATQAPVVNDEVVAAPKPRRGSLEPTSAVTAAALQDEPAALYLMNMVEEPSVPVHQVPSPSLPSVSVAQPAQATPTNADSRLAAAIAAPRKSPSPERPRIVTSFESRSNNEPLGRKPSGARAPPPKKGSTHSARTLESISDNSSPPPQPLALESDGQPQKTRLPSSGTMSDMRDDAAEYLAFAENLASPEEKPVPAPHVSTAPNAEEELRSSFAPSRAAAERKARAEQAAMDKLTARAVPGGGKRVASTAAAAWSGSEDEDEPEAEEEHSPIAENQPRYAQQTTEDSSGPVQRVLSQTRALPPVPRSSMDEMTYNRNSEYRESQYPQQAQPPPPQREQSGFGTGIPRPRSGSPAAPHRNASTAPAPQPPAQRQTLWNANFSADHGMEQPRSGKFVEIEEPSVKLTKAFAPHGLLQAGMQDKDDRSAKKQEELARETGSSLINVPSKPPPPQIGLLGAVAAHERDRKGAGGIGATLTDREREKRLAEERQREIEKLQRQQMELMSKYGDPNMSQQQNFGQYPYGMPPNMRNMSMMGMPPMGYNPYQAGYNPYAQQQAMMAAQMAYHQALMMSQAGSQIGGPTHGSPDRPASPASIASGPSPPPMGSYPTFFQPGYPFMGGMGMSWPGSPSPGLPMGQMMGGGSWLQPPGSMGGGGGSDDGSKSRVQSTMSDHPPIN